MHDEPPFFCVGFGILCEPGSSHTPVLTKEVLELLDVRRGDTVLDTTVGFGGHARLFAERLGREGTLLGMDVDPSALVMARRNLATGECRVELLEANFNQTQEALADLGIEQVDVLLADLGLSSAQLDDPARGFSFQHDGPLDMRLDPRLKTTAADLVNRLKEKELSDILYFNAQERASRRIARWICRARKEARIVTTERLVEVVSKALGVKPLSRKSKTHPATRTFMALRMAVNDELAALDALLAQAPALLRAGGRIGVISFHSVEDRRVKRDFLKRKSDGLYQLLTKKPVVAGDDERRANPRARSAKLRVARRIAEG